MADRVVDITRPSLPKRARPATEPQAAPQPIGPTPLWLQRFQEHLGSWAKGYAFAVSHFDPVSKQSVVYSHGHGLARGRFGNSQVKLWDGKTRCNLASVSKTITAVAITLAYWTDNGDWLNRRFWDLIKHQDTFKGFTPGTDVDKVTLKQLLTQTSGMVVNDDLDFDDHDIWGFLKTYLADPASGNAYAYSNTNFTILQAVLELNQSGYVNYVTDQVLNPMDIDTQLLFTPKPEPRNDATLVYRDALDSREGYYIKQMDAVGAGGWIAPAEQLIKFLIGLRNESVLSTAKVDFMLDHNLGCYPIWGAYGGQPYYWHNGGLGYWVDDTHVSAEVHTGWVRLADGWDAVLLVNSGDGTAFPDPISLMVEAFDAGAHADLTPIYRYFDKTNTSHYYSAEQSPPASGSWSFEGVRFYTPKPTQSAWPQIYQPGAPAIHQYVSTTDADLYRYNSGGGDIDGFKDVGTPFCAFQPMGADVQTGWAPLTEYQLNTDENVRFYTSRPDQENLGGWTKVTEIGYVYDALATPVFEYWTTGEHGEYVLFYTTDPPAEALNGWWCNGIKFYALASRANDTIPLNRYYLQDESIYHWFSALNVPLPPGNWLAQDTNIYVYGQQIAGTEPLYAYKLNSDPDKHELLSADPSLNPESQYTKIGIAGYVYVPKWGRWATSPVPSDRLTNGLPRGEVFV